MRTLCALFAAGLAGAGTAQPADPRLAAAETLIDAFYAFEPERLRAALADAPGSAPQILYYQGWAEGGHYRIIARQPCRAEKANTVRCDITVADDLLPALGSDLRVTDSFHIGFDGRRIVSVDTSSNDPPEFAAALDWLKRTRPALFESGECRGFFAGGPTPQACIRAVVAGFRDYAAQPRR